jgi:chemotaxis protein CheD
MANLTVGIADCKVSNDPRDTLVTHALGSCIAVILYEPVAGVAGLLHFMLPDSTIDTTRALERPYMFADTGIPLLLHRATALGAVRSSMSFMAAGGSSMLEDNGAFNVAERNHQALTSIFQFARLRIKAQDIGGSAPRTLSIDVANGRIHVKRPDSQHQELIHCLAPK